ncbi:hypothetical protein NADFUDRAFT_42787 [Nadsonia fulvescens var. elongata DSM 6958]|uniref:GATA-type domain-containing protein n=1 Tax=Nadsonia fulvescens var. elongata DSM 6958 TaxID=857566 RepID=A0A1E3PGX5_9ASCO|nr:hypothetical protein NADFUDRAFT_42787 [Nadsonia fulvescens var. elongata DSM 6958]
MSFSHTTTQYMKLKILYTFDRDDSITCLTRSMKSSSVIIPAKNNEIGLISLRSCVNCVIAASPEIVADADSYDFVVYSTDFSEPGLPQVSHGLLSWMLVLGDDFERNTPSRKCDDDSRDNCCSPSSITTGNPNDCKNATDKIAGVSTSKHKEEKISPDVQWKDDFEYEENLRSVIESKHNYMITGKICDNILASSPSDNFSILEIRLRLKPVSSTTQADFSRSINLYTQLSSLINNDQSSRDFDPRVWSDWISGQTRLMSLLQQQKILDRQAKLTKKQETWSTRSGYLGLSSKNAKIGNEGLHTYSETSHSIDSDDPYLSLESNLYVPPSSPPMNTSQMNSSEHNISSRNLKLSNDLILENSLKIPQRIGAATFASASSHSGSLSTSPAPLFSIKEMIKKMDKEKQKTDLLTHPHTTTKPALIPNTLINLTKRGSNNFQNKKSVPVANIMPNTLSKRSIQLDSKQVSSPIEQVSRPAIIIPATDNPIVTSPNKDNLPVLVDSTKILLYDKETNLSVAKTHGKKISRNATSKTNRERFAKRKDIIALELYEDMKAGRTPKYCENCGAIHTSTWRRAKHQLYSKTFSKVKLAQHTNIKEDSIRKVSPEKDFLLCNPCGIYLREKKEMRPESLWDPKKGVDALAHILQHVHETLEIEGKNDKILSQINEANLSSIISSVKLLQQNGGSAANPLSLKRTVAKSSAGSAVKRIKSLPALLNISVDEKPSVSLGQGVTSSDKLVNSILSEPRSVVNESFRNESSNLKYDANLESSFANFASSPPSKSRNESITDYGDEEKDSLKPIIEDFFQSNEALNSLFNTPKACRPKEVVKTSDSFSPSSWLNRDLFGNETKFLHVNSEGNSDICDLLSDVFTSPISGENRQESYFPSVSKLPTINDDRARQMGDIPSSPLLSSYRNSILSNPSEPMSMLSSGDGCPDIWSDLQSTSPPKITSYGLTTIDGQKKMKSGSDIQNGYLNAAET